MTENQMMSDLVTLAQEQVRAASKDKLRRWCDIAPGEHEGPYPWQVKFHNATANHAELGAITANQVGKTRSGAIQVAMWCTGIYPDWYTGRRFPRAVNGIVAGITNASTRDVVQYELLGKIGPDRKPEGTGWIPADCIGRFGFRQCGMPDVLDQVYVKHISGDWSLIRFMAYQQGGDVFQGYTDDFAWMDEEPPLNEQVIMRELQRGLAVHEGILLMTRTPLDGLTDCVNYFWSRRGETTGEVFCINANWEDDAPHLSGKRKKHLIETWPRHEVPARTMGIPKLGSGVIYDWDDREVMIESIAPQEFPKWWARVAAIDYGINHPTVVLWAAHDRDNDQIILYDLYEQTGETAEYHAAAISRRGNWIPVVGPHDGAHREKSSGIALADQYRNLGVNMLPLTARFDDNKGGSQSREAAVQLVDSRARTDGLKVMAHLKAWFMQKNQFHRKDGKIVAVKDDIMSATEYICMMIRHSQTEQEARPPRLEMNEVNEWNPFTKWEE